MPYVQVMVATPNPTRCKQCSPTFVPLMSPTLPCCRFTKSTAIWLMPLPTRADGLSPATARLLEAPLKGHVAALRAHLTRSRDAAAKAKGGEAQALEAKALDYERRIAEVLARSGAKALPSPEAIAAAITKAEDKADAGRASAAKRGRKRDAPRP